MSSSDDDNRVRQRGPEGNLEEYVPRDDGHQALREMLQEWRQARFILRDGPLRQAVLALLTDRDEMAVNLARADEENDKRRDELNARLDALGDEVKNSNNLRRIAEALGASAAEALALLADIKSWDCEAEQMLTLPIALRQRMQAALAAKNEATTHELHAAQEADELRARIEAAHKACGEAVTAVIEPRKGVPEARQWDDGYKNGVQACASVVWAALTPRRA